MNVDAPNLPLIISDLVNPMCCDSSRQFDAQSLRKLLFDVIKGNDDPPCCHWPDISNENNNNVSL